MLTKDYVESARRHLYVCQMLLLEIGKTSLSADKKCQLLAEIYYLSGYVIESMLSYAVCAHHGVIGDVMESSHFKENSFKTHNLPYKVQYALGKQCKIQGIKLITQRASNKQQKLYNQWNVKYRYETCASLNKDDLLLFVELIDDVYKKILSKYPLI